MKIIAFFSQKGGSGKTTLAVHCAVAAHEAGRRVVLIDTDPQQSATVWGNARKSRPPVVEPASVFDLARVLEAKRAEHMQLAIIDAAPHASADAAKIARACDLVLIPIRPALFDLAAAEAAVRVIKAAKVRAAFVLSACPARAPEVAETREALAVHGLPVSPVEIGDRRAYARALVTGNAVTEFESQGKAAAETRALWQWITKELR